MIGFCKVFPLLSRHIEARTRYFHPNPVTMGLSFHYSGSFNKNASLSKMIEEVKDIAEVNQWKCAIYEKQFPSKDFGGKTYNRKIYGISFSPHECEPVWICFLSNGKMSSPLNLQMFGQTKNENQPKYLYMLSVKTQYAGIHVHEIVIDLLKYLDKKYFSELRVYDEGKYWETGDDELLQTIFKRYDAALQIAGAALDQNSRRPNETFEQYLERILTNKRKNGY